MTKRILVTRVRLVSLLVLGLLQRSNAFQTPRYTPAAANSRSVTLWKKTRFRALPVSGQENASDKDSMAKRVQGRKKRVIIGYRVSSVLYALLAVAILAVAKVPVGLNYAGGPILAAGTAHILAGAALNDRLNSQTYQRLNLILSMFGSAWLVAAFLVRAKLVCNPLVILASLLAFINGIKGWAYGVKGWDKATDTTFANELKALLKDSFKVLISPPQNIRAKLYLTSIIYVLILKILKLGDLLTIVSAPNGTTSAKLGYWVVANAKILLLGTASFTLFDAANRDRLKGTTFVQLNGLTAFVWLGLGAYFFRGGQIIGAVLACVFSAFSLLTGATFYLVKRKQ